MTLVTQKHLGRWRIAEMGRWDADFIDLVVPGFIRFDGRGGGEFQFGTVQGQFRFRAGGYEEKYRIVFAWEGAVEFDPAKGTGWAEVGNEGLRGHIYIHDGDDSWFKAKREG